MNFSSVYCARILPWGFSHFYLVFGVYVAALFGMSLMECGSLVWLYQLVWVERLDLGLSDK